MEDFQRGVYISKEIFPEVYIFKGADFVVHR